MKIYTKTGDKGETSLYGGTRVSKAAARVESYGTLDELNAFIGLAKAEISDEKVLSQLQKIQFDLFTVGSEAATPTDKMFLVKTKSVRLVQPLNALLPIDVTFLLSLTLTSEVRLINVSELIDVIESPISALFNAVQPKNTSVPNEVTLSGIIIDFSAVQS